MSHIGNDICEKSLNYFKWNVNLKKKKSRKEILKRIRYK